MIIVGRKRDPGFFDRYATAITDSVLETAPAEVVFLHGELPEGPVSRILLPFGENVHTRLALEVAPALVEYFGSRLDVLLVMPTALDPVEVERRTRKVRESVGTSNGAAGLRIVRSDDVVRSVVAEAHHTDVLLMGGRTGSFWEMLAAASLTEDITRQARCPVVWVEEYEESESLLARALGRTKEGTQADGN